MAKDYGNEVSCTCAVGWNFHWTWQRWVLNSGAGAQTLLRLWYWDPLWLVKYLEVNTTPEHFRRSPAPSKTPKTYSMGKALRCCTCCTGWNMCLPCPWVEPSPLRAGPQQALLWASFQTYFLLLQLSDKICVGTSVSKPDEWRSK